MTNSAVQAHLALFSVALIYGGNYVIAREVMGNAYLEPLGFILLRVTAALLLFSLFHAAYIREKVEKQDLFLLAVCGFFGVAINQMFFFSGLKLSSPINASLIMTTTPMLVLIVSAFLLKEKITTNRVLGILLGAIGAILLIVYGKSIEVGGEAWLGNLMVFINASSYGFYLVIVKPLMQKYNPFTVIKWVFFFGFLFVFPFGFQQLAIAPWSTFPAETWISIVYVLIFTTFFAYILNAFALSKVNPSIVSFYIYLQPLTAGLIALSLGKETLTTVKLVSAAFLFAGVYLVSIPSKTPILIYQSVAKRFKR